MYNLATLKKGVGPDALEDEAAVTMKLFNLHDAVAIQVS